MKSTWQFNGIKGYLFGHKMASIRSNLQKYIDLENPTHCANCRALHLDEVEIYTTNTRVCNILSGMY